ncbi:TatD DNase family protein [Rheinheimera pacifica]|uniref:TatD DNase family protein n=1 Tax=Rheinheimera pacifica TaxID=173990 RepID=A0A1H6MRJ3_9GAMM|nr:TatD family hydrolase [Rheinheimera pacifica]SEI04552.1 TatD DNase family protein [Rheinheimera pacifica]
MWCDIGVNLFSSQFDNDRAAVIERAAQADVAQLLLIGSDIDESRQNITFCQQHRSCVSTAGVHPHQAANVKSDWLIQLQALSRQAEVVAIGECGLDFNRDFSPRDQQQQVFAEQLQLAGLCGKPVYLHERDAFTTQLAMLKEQQVSHGVVHCFTGDVAQLKAYLELGLYIGITGWVCDERRGEALQQALSYIPADKLLLETDAPYLLPRTMQPKPKSRRNEPAYLPVIAQMVARLTNRSMDELATLTWQNSRRLFGFQHSLSTAYA